MPNAEALRWMVTALCIATMGFAVQRGATCTVAAVDEIITRRKANRLIAMLEAAAWVGGGLAVAALLGRPSAVTVGYAASGWTVLGATLLGLGAYVNRACVFGAIARLGSGQWAYLATPVGFYFGWLVVAKYVPRSVVMPLSDIAPALMAGNILVLLFAGLLSWRLWCAFKNPWKARLSAAWSPHGATSVIGLCFLVIVLIGGKWAYTDLLQELATKGMVMSLLSRVVLFLMLLIGAVLGGLTSGRWQPPPVQALTIVRCLAGGFIMACGSALIPGSNDGLLLIGLPLLWPYAWLAFGAMGVAIAVAQLVGARSVAKLAQTN